jgi:hypothetical protein
MADLCRDLSNLWSRLEQGRSDALTTAGSPKGAQKGVAPPLLVTQPIRESSHRTAIWAREGPTQGPTATDHSSAPEMKRTSSILHALVSTTTNDRTTIAAANRRGRGPRAKERSSETTKPRAEWRTARTRSDVRSALW